MPVFKLRKLSLRNGGKDATSIRKREIIGPKATIICDPRWKSSSSWSANNLFLECYEIYGNEVFFAPSTGGQKFLTVMTGKYIADGASELEACSL